MVETVISPSDETEITDSSELFFLLQVFTLMFPFKDIEENHEATHLDVVGEGVTNIISLCIESSIGE